MRVELYISNKRVDLFGGAEITYEYNFVNFGEIAKRQGAMAVSFDVPKTNNNRDIFENSGNAQSASLVPYSWFDSRLEIDGKDAGLPLCALESVSENYTIRLFGSKQNLGEILNDLQLSDLNLDDLNHHWDNVDIKWCRDNNKPITYPLLDSTDVSPSYFKNVGYSGLMPPFIDGHYLLEQIFVQNGYSLTNKCKDSGMFSKVTPFVPLMPMATPIRDMNASRYIGKFILSSWQFGTSETNTNVLSITNQNQRYWRLGFNKNTNFGGDFIFHDKVRITIKLSGTITAPFGDGEGNIYIYSTNTATSGRVVVETIPISILSGGSLSFSHTGTYDVFFDTAGSMPTPARFGFTTSGNDNLFVQDGLTFEIIGVEMIDSNYDNYDARENIIYQTGGGGADWWNYITVSSCLPDWTQKKFLDNYLLMTCSYLTVDSETNTAIIAPLNQIYSNFSRRLNWSGKVDFSEEPTTEFTFFELAKTNKLLYADTDLDFVRAPLTDSFFEINDANLEAEKDAVKLDFLPCETSSLNTIIPSTPVIVCKIPMFRKSTLEHIESDPRIVLIKKLNGSFLYQATNTGSSSEDYMITNNIPFAYFVDESQTYSIGFGDSLKNEYYSIVEDLANQTKALTCKMRLNVIDLSEIDNLRLVFIDELNGNFLVLKITKDLASEGLSEVKLLKI